MSIESLRLSPSLVAVTRDPSKLDVFMVGLDSNVYTAAWDRNQEPEHWRGWWALPPIAAVPGSPLYAIARDPAKLDVFVVGTDAFGYTAAWNQNDTPQTWKGWWKIADTSSFPGIPGSSIFTISRDPTKLDVFVIGSDANVYTASWDQNANKQQWNGWWQLPPVSVIPGSDVSVVSRDPTKLDIFLVGADGNVYTAAWDGNQEPEHWRGWWALPPVPAVPGSPVCAVCRDPAKIDVFIIGADSNVYTAAWDQNDKDQQWKGWWKITENNSVGTIPGSNISAVSRDPTKLDVFIIGSDTFIYTAAWDQNDKDQQWKGWWKITEQSTVPSIPGSLVYATSRETTQIDIFITGTDNSIYTAAWDQNDNDQQWKGWWKTI